MEQYTGCTIQSYTCRCFEKLTEEEVALMDKHSVTVKYKKGELICKQGGLASHMFFVENGLAKVFLDDGVNSLVLKVVTTGNLLGLSSVSADTQTYQYSAMTYIDSEIKQIDIQFFKKLLAENPAFSKEVIAILGANSAQINGRFFCFTHKQSYGRIADILLCLADRIFKLHEFDLPLSRKDLAELCGMSQETVVRMLKKFDEEGLIQIKGKYFRIIDYDRLKTISEKG
jgi:CRP/FNR family transcriptional regulator, polysaccharide utilization system transcription regulator